jgi:mono/diheme cytochrome c family protein
LNLKISFKFRSILAVLALAGACVSGRMVPIAGPNDVARGVKKYPDLTTEQLVEGRKLFAGHCGSCHQPPRPTSRPAQEWPGHIREMKERARLSDHELDLIERYVVTMSLAPDLSATSASKRR